jgi:hypothetical protein
MYLRDFEPVLQTELEVLVVYLVFRLVIEVRDQFAVHVLGGEWEVYVQVVQLGRLMLSLKYVGQVQFENVTFGFLTKAGEGVFEQRVCSGDFPEVSSGQSLHHRIPLNKFKSLHRDL